MHVAGTVPPATAVVPLYARFSRAAFAASSSIGSSALVAIAGALLAASTVAIDSVSRALGIAVIAALVLYASRSWCHLPAAPWGIISPISAGGRTMRPAAMSALLKACARLLIKGFLGWYSFVCGSSPRTLAAIRRSTIW